jgi:multidrug efflux system outer membrane protein
MHLIHLSRLTLLSASALLVGCMVGPDYQRPEVATPATYIADLDQGESIANLEWWELFGDPHLESLIRLSLEENRDLRVAVARVDEARARLGIARSEFFPTIDGRASFSRGNAAEQLFPDAGIDQSYFIGGEAAYEVDLWGRIRRANQAARAELLASAENQRTVIIVLVSEVATTYLLLRDLDARVDIATDTLEARKGSTALIQARFDQGTSPLLDVNQAQIEEAEAAATLASLKRQVHETENLLNVLVGRNPRPIIRGRRLGEQIAIPNVPAGLPADLVERRPDVRSAELQLEAQTARIGVAQALRFPSINLTSSLGWVSDELDDFTDNDTKIWNVDVDILGPIFDAGKRRSQVEEERARTEQALNNYEQAILQSFREVEDALAGIQGYRDELTARQMQVTAAQSASNLSRARYDGGVTDYLEVLDSDRSLFDAQLAASAIRRLELTSIVRLYKSLGGGWETSEEQQQEQQAAAGAEQPGNAAQEADAPEPGTP